MIAGMREEEEGGEKKSISVAFSLYLRIIYSTGLLFSNVALNPGLSKSSVSTNVVTTHKNDG